MNTKRSGKVALSINPTDARRIQITLQCRDTESLPRVPEAGMIVAGENGRYQIMHNGIKVIENGYIGPWVTELIQLLKGFHEPQEEKAFAEILNYIPAHATMLELGSWWSYYSLWFQKKIPHAHNYMIEPDINNLRVGMTNFKLNEMEGHHVNAAIGKQSISSIPYRCYESDNVERPVPVYSVDDFLEREAIQSVDLLLADIQGFELEMLQGATRSMQKGVIRFIVISTHHHSISHDPLIHQKCLEVLEKHSARILVEHTISESFSGDGLIVASLNPRDQNLPNIEVSRNFPRNNLFRETERDLGDVITERQGLAAALKAKEDQRRRLETLLISRKTESRQFETVQKSGKAERQQLEAALNAKEAERQGLESALDTKEAERQQLEAALNAKGAEKQGLESDLNAKEAIRQKLEAALNGKEAERQGLAAALNAKEEERQELAAALIAKETERQQLETSLTVRKAESQQFKEALTSAQAGLQRLESDLSAKEAARQKLEAALTIKEIEQHGLEAALNAKEVERQQLEASLVARQAESQRFEADLKSAQAERQVF